MLRPARREDLAAILDIANEAIRTTTAVYSYAPGSMDERIAWFEQKERAGLPVLVCELDGGVAGFATFGPFRPWPAYKYTVEHSLYVHRDRRAKAWAKACSWS